MRSGKTISKRGTPLAMLAVLLGVWVCMRAVTWDSPLVYTAMAKSTDTAAPLLQTKESLRKSVSASMMPAPQSIAYPQFRQYLPYPPTPYPTPYGYVPYPRTGYYAYPPPYLTPSPQMYGPATRGLGYPAMAAAYPLAPRQNGDKYPSAQQRLLLDWRLNGASNGSEARVMREGQNLDARQVAPAPFPAQPSYAVQASADRWMLDAFGFFRQGSNAATIPQGRRPIYGASQIAANLQWRARPSSSHDPRVYARAYHALVARGETELAAGVSALPLRTVPVRLYGELRATRTTQQSNGAFSPQTSLRPAAYAATEIPQQELPLGLSLEAYGAGGYVGGNAETYFIDGQAAVTRRLLQLGKSGSRSASVSFGAGVWGGAQKDARRVDVGPTLRFDVDIGNLPARVSVDYREQVAGDAEPDSGVAATVSTRF